MEYEILEKKSNKKNLNKKKSERSNENNADFVTFSAEESRVRAKLVELKEFYTSLLVYGIVCVFSIIVWLSMGCGTFWPIWVIIGCGINVGLKAISLGQIPWFEEFFPFLSDDWEERQVEVILNSSSEEEYKKHHFMDSDTKQKLD